jgi:hypothetical protein
MTPSGTVMPLYGAARNRVNETRNIFVYTKRKFKRFGLDVYFPATVDGQIYSFIV